MASEATQLAAQDVVTEEVDLLDQIVEKSKVAKSRTKLADLRNKLAGNEKLEDLLTDVLNNTEQLKKLGAAKEE